jgi:hypothetical protein
MLADGALVSGVGDGGGDVGGGLGGGTVLPASFASEPPLQPAMPNARMTARIGKLVTPKRRRKPGLPCSETVAMLHPVQTGHPPTHRLVIAANLS